MLQMFVLALSLYNTWNRGVFLLCKITNLLIYSYNYINGIMNASDVSLYSDVWAIIPTTSGSKTVYSTATVPGASSYYVRLLQACLNYLGYNSGSADGIYGTKTKSAIKSFQRNNGLTVDGIAGEMTWRYIDIRVDTYSETHGKVPF